MDVLALADQRPLTKADLPEIIRRYEAGESIQSLAKLSNRHRDTLYQWMLAYQGETYHESVTRALVGRLAESDGLLDGLWDEVNKADTSSDIARVNSKIQIAREKMRYARFDLERRRPQLYGQKQQIESKSVRFTVDRSVSPVESENNVIDIPNPEDVGKGKGQ